MYKLYSNVRLWNMKFLRKLLSSTNMQDVQGELTHARLAIGRALCHQHPVEVLSPGHFCHRRPAGLHPDVGVTTTLCLRHIASEQSCASAILLHLLPAESELRLLWNWKKQGKTYIWWVTKLSPGWYFVMVLWSVARLLRFLSFIIKNYLQSLKSGFLLLREIIMIVVW